MPSWNQILDEIKSWQGAHVAPITAIRRKYLKQLGELTGRNIIAYYSGWLSSPGNVSMTLTDEDKNGFMTCIHNLDPLEASQDFQDLVLSVHHCYMHTLMNTTIIKIVENQNGIALAKLQNPT